MYRLNSIKFFLLLTVILSALVLLGGCSREGENIPTAYPTVVSELDAGWSSFEKSQYANAVFHFTNAKDRDAVLIDAYNGLGWTNTRTGNYIESEQNFKLMLALTNDQGVQANGYAGMAFNYFATPLDMEEADVVLRDSIAIDYAEKALAIMSDYQFAHDSNVNAKSLHILIAECCFNRKEYLTALNEIETYIEPGFTNNLLQTGVLEEAINDTSKVILLNETPLSGRAKITLDKELVKINSITSLDQKTSYSIESFEEGGNSIFFRGNPIPQKNELFLVSYYYAPNYGQFLAALMDKLQNLL